MQGTRTFSRKNASWSIDKKLFSDRKRTFPSTICFEVNMDLVEFTEEFELKQNHYLNLTGIPFSLKELKCFK